MGRGKNLGKGRLQKWEDLTHITVQTPEYKPGRCWCVTGALTTETQHLRSTRTRTAVVT